VKGLFRWAVGRLCLFRWSVGPRPHRWVLHWRVHAELRAAVLTEHRVARIRALAASADGHGLRLNGRGRDLDERRLSRRRRCVKRVATRRAEATLRRVDGATAHARSGLLRTKVELRRHRALARRRLARRRRCELWRGCRNESLRRRGGGGLWRLGEPRSAVRAKAQTFGVPPTTTPANSHWRGYATTPRAKFRNAVWGPGPPA
jgi:hypothetical protein